MLRDYLNLELCCRVRIQTLIINFLLKNLPTENKLCFLLTDEYDNPEGEFVDLTISSYIPVTLIFGYCCRHIDLKVLKEIVRKYEYDMEIV